MQKINRSLCCVGLIFATCSLSSPSNRDKVFKLRLAVQGGQLCPIEPFAENELIWQKAITHALREGKTEEADALKSHFSAYKAGFRECGDIWRFGFIVKALSFAVGFLSFPVLVVFPIFVRSCNPRYTKE